eukprot:s1400_g10.t1
MRGVFLLFTCHFLANAETSCPADVLSTTAEAFELDEDHSLEMLQVKAAKDSAEKSEEDWLETRTGFATIHPAGVVAPVVDMFITTHLDGGVDGVTAPPMCTTTPSAGAVDGVMVLRCTTIVAMVDMAGATVLRCIIAMVGVERCEVSMICAEFKR